jgi:hypothetical protein
MTRNSKIIKLFGTALIVVIVFFVLGMWVDWLRPSLGKPIVWGSFIGLFLIFITLGVLVLARNRLALRAAIVGLLVAVLLLGLRLYLARLGLDSGVGAPLFLILCPPIIGTMALDNAGPTGTAVGVLIVALENAGLYALIAVVINWLRLRLRSGSRAS